MVSSSVHGSPLVSTADYAWFWKNAVGQTPPLRRMEPTDIVLARNDVRSVCNVVNQWLIAGLVAKLAVGTKAPNRASPRSCKGYVPAAVSVASPPKRGVSVSRGLMFSVPFPRIGKAVPCTPDVADCPEKVVGWRKEQNAFDVRLIGPYCRLADRSRNSSTLTPASGTL